MQNEYQKQLEDYMSKKDSMSDIMMQLKEKRLLEQQQMIQKKSEDLQNDLQVLNERAYKPIEDNLKKAIAVVAKKYEITYVFDESNLMYIGDGIDLTKEVKAEMLRMETPKTTTN